MRRPSRYGPAVDGYILRRLALIVKHS